MLFPEPDGPMMATISPPADLDVDAVERVHGGLPLAVDLGQPTRLQSGFVHPPHCVVGVAPDVGQGCYGAPSTSLRLLDPLDRSRVDSAPSSELKRQEVAEHHRPQQSLGAALALGLHADHRRGIRLDEVRGQIDPLPHARMLVAVAEEDRAQTSGLPRSLPAGDLVVVGLRELRAERGQLRVLVDLRLPPRGDGDRQVGAVDDRDGAVQPLGETRGELGKAAAGLAQVGRGAVDLGADPRRRAHQGRDLGGRR